MYGSVGQRKGQDELLFHVISFGKATFRSGVGQFAKH
jgi:hypothetical protein